MLLLTGAVARAQDGPVRPSDLLKDERSIHPPRNIGRESNPAAEYFRIWDTVTFAQRREMGDIAGLAGRDDGKKLDQASRRVCETQRDYIDALIRNANAGPCDWGINVEAGWETSFPHLSLLRASLRMVRMDAYRCIDDGSYAAASERVAAMIRMSDQTRSDGTMISAMTGGAICEAGMRVAEAMLKDKQVSPASARIMLSALRSLPKDNIFGSTSAIEYERRTSIEWARSRFKGEAAGARFMQEAGLGMGGDPFNRFIYGMNGQQLDADLNRCSKYYEALATAWKQPYRTMRLIELNMEVWEGQFGAVARVAVPAMDRYSIQMERTNAEIAKVMRELSAVADPQTGAAPTGDHKP
jgi:hypothetical protein